MLYAKNDNEINEIYRISGTMFIGSSLLMIALLVLGI